jgi:hypothetical protein
VLKARDMKAKVALGGDIDLEKFFDRVNHVILMVTVGATNQRQACAALDSQIPASGDDVGRTTARKKEHRKPKKARC